MSESTAQNAWPVPGALAFVCPRYGTEVLGGAETVVREMAERLHARGLPVEVLTTCAVDHHTWENSYDPGMAYVNGIGVHRFPIERGNVKRQRALGDLIGSGRTTSLEEQESWLNEGFRSSGLFHHLMENHNRYHTIILTPYMFWTTYACAQIAPHKNLLRPCLHDEIFARLDIYKPIFRDARGIIFNTDPEAELARGLFELPQHTDVVGEGIDVPTGVDAMRFRRKFGIDGEFVLYTGRREWGKNVDLLAEYFARYVHRTQRDDLKLVLTGRGEVKIPKEIRKLTVDLGFVSEQDKHDAYAAATVVCQPSLWESFSRLVLEAWVGGTPVLAYDRCEVTAHHVRTSEGGLLYDDATSFEVALSLLLEQPELRERMGANGREYVLSRYRWDDVIDRLVRDVSEWALEDVQRLSGAPT
jgi:glycosyltransferase involved in cell wall biosynthesis